MAGDNLELGLSYPLSSNIMTHMTYIVKGLKDVLRRNSRLNIAQYRVLGLLMRTSAAVAPNEIARRLSLSPSAVAGALDALAAGGCVAMARDPDDRRRKSIEVLPEGARQAAEAERAAAEFVQQLWRPLSNQQKRLILDGCLKTDRLRSTRADGPDSAHGILLYIENACTVVQKVTQAVRPAGLSLNEFRVLFELATNPQTTRSSDLSRRLCLRSNEVAMTVGALAGQGLVEQTLDACDQRCQRLALTELGWQRTAAAAPLVDAVFCSGTYQTTAGERAAFLAIADLVVEALVPMR